MQMLATVKYQIATYSGEIKVNCNDKTSNEEIIARAQKLLYRRSGGPFTSSPAYESWKVIKKEVS